MGIRAAVLPMGATPLTVYRPRYQRLTQVVTAAIKYCLHPFFANNINNDDKTRKHAAVHQQSLSLSVYLSVCLDFSVADRMDPDVGRCPIPLTSPLGTLCATVIYDERFNGRWCLAVAL